MQNVDTFFKALQRLAGVSRCAGISVFCFANALLVGRYAYQYTGSTTFVAYIWYIYGILVLYIDSVNSTV